MRDVNVALTAITPYSDAISLYLVEVATNIYRVIGKN